MMESSFRRLTEQGFDRARSYIKSHARPLERARFAYEFEHAGREPTLVALKAFRNRDGGFGHGLEPDLWMPGSSVLCTVEALDILKEVDVPTTHEFVTAAVDWLVRAFDPDLAAWRSVTAEAEGYPHAPWWNWELHADGTRWPVGVLPRAEVLSHLWRSAERVPMGLLEDQTRRLVSDFAAGDRDMVGDADTVSRCETFVRSANAPQQARDAVARQMVDSGRAIVSREPKDWLGYSAKPLKLAPTPDCVLAKPLADEVERNLDWEIDHQDIDGSWAPNWTWNGGYPDQWLEAERWWRGDITLKMLQSLRAYGRLS